MDVLKLENISNLELSKLTCYINCANLSYVQGNWNPLVGVNNLIQIGFEHVIQKTKFFPILSYDPNITHTHFQVDLPVGIQV
jgi:hypothetical protein